MVTESSGDEYMYRRQLLKSFYRTASGLQFKSDTFCWWKFKPAAQSICYNWLWIMLPPISGTISHIQMGIQKLLWPLFLVITMESLCTTNDKRVGTARDNLLSFAYVSL